MGLTSARRHALSLKLDHIEEQIVSVQEELFNLEQEASQSNPSLFVHEHFGVKALKHQLEHLEKVAMEIREELRNE